MPDYDIGDALHRIELLLLASMRRNLKHHLSEEHDQNLRWSMWQAEQLTTLGNWTRRNYRQFSPEFTRINRAAISLLQSSAARAQLVEEGLLLRTGIQRAGGFFVAPEEKLQSLLNAVRHDLSQAEHSILRQADDVYRRTLFDAQMYLQTGSGTLDNAIDMAVQDFMQRGIRSVVYRNGHRVEASTYARMALRSANVRAVMTGEGAARDRFGVHTVIVSPSGIACEKCAPWMGQILVDDVYCSGSREEAAELGVPLLSEAVSSGLLHPQCNCAVHTFQPGISRLPEVTDADREQAVNRYKLTQQQRYNERQIRKWKYAEDAAPDPAAQQAAHAKVRAWQQTNKALCDAHPDELRRDYQREKIWDAPRNPVVPGVIEKTPDKPLTAGAERGTIGTEQIHAIGDDTAPPYDPNLSYDARVTEEVRTAVTEERAMMEEKFGKIGTIAGVDVLKDRSSDEGAYNDNSYRISLRHADEKNALKTMAAIAQQKKGKGMWSTGNPRHAIRHEIAHAIQRHYFHCDVLWADKKSRIFAIYEKAKEGVDGYRLPSIYAGDDMDEFISECIAASFAKNVSKTVKEVIAIILGGEM